MSNFFSKEILSNCIMTPQEQASVESGTCPSCGSEKFISTQAEDMVFCKCCSCENIYVLAVKTP